ncbi:MAG: hypothetical protein PUB21_02310 [Bacteroidales bacterium]|nr:hypothetical protein [Bacteroidales bacterium]
MKHSIILLLLCAGMFFQLSAQEESQSRLRKRYVNFNFVNQTFTPASGFLDTDQGLKSNFGAAITVGRTFYLHKKPLAKMIRIGLDATWFDLNYTNYKLLYKYSPSNSDGYEDESYSFHQAEIAMQVGPSISVNPISKMNIHAYFRYAPSFSALYNGDGIYGNYATYFVTGAAVSYGVIGLGIEARFGNCKYKEFGGGGDDDEGDYGDYDDNYDDEPATTPSFKSKFSGLRFYISFRL